MNFHEISLWISNVLVFAAFSIYIYSILKGWAKPHRTTRFVLLIITSLATFSLIAQHNQVAVWLAGIAAIMSAMVFVLTLKYGMGGWAKIDLACLIIALFGIIIWQITNNPATALFAAILADFTGVVPTIIKIYHHPQTEVWTFFTLGGLGSLFNLLAVTNWTIEEIAYPLYLVLISTILVILMFRKKISGAFNK
ncbi:hypothetical protein C4579_01280 [Candidatus Microgenomates bacterium]|nr:MAG: hypothetical protein C4579_01280 [Candidatus Microgenomates bacterium]